MKWEVKRCVGLGTVTMSRGTADTEWQAPAFRADVYLDGRYMGTVTNSSFLCLPGGGVQAPEATDRQIAAAVIGDEHVYDTQADGSIARQILES